MNFKLVPTICLYCGSYLAEKVGKVIDVKPWMELIANYPMTAPECTI